MTVPPFASFQSTVTPFVRGESADRFHVLEDPFTGAPVGLQSPRGNGAQGIWTPVDLTPGQLASPTAAMLADLNAIFRLNVSPYTRYQSNGTSLLPAILGGNVIVRDPAAETESRTFTTTEILSANNAQDVLGLVSRMHVEAQSFNATSSHTTAFYGEGSAFDTIAGGTVSTISAFVGVSGNQGLGTVTKAVDFYGHASINSGGGALPNHYFLYQESSTAASNEYGGYLSAPLGIGTTAPSYNLDINGGAGGNVSATNWIRAGTGTGTLLVTSTGTALFPGFSPGAGGFGATDIIVGNNGAANLTTATTAFLYISSCAGTPTGVPAKAAVGRIAMEYDTTADKLWMYNGSAWKSVALT